jgi:mevalonate kinase
MNKLNINSGVSVKIDQKIPLGSGLGSSSNYSVASSLAFSKLFSNDTSLEAINSLAFGLERFKHGMPSGGDNSTCCYGGLIWFQKNPSAVRLIFDIHFKLLHRKYTNIFLNCNIDYGR